MANEIVSLDIPQDELARYHGVVTAVAPWAKNLNATETGLVLRKVLAMGLNPLDGREVHIWKDKRGSVNVQPHYSLIVEWVEKTKPRHTEPIFERLPPSSLREEGLPEDAIAYRCRFMLIEDVDRMTQMLLSGAFDSAKEVRAMFEIRGLGVALAAEYKGAYFSPAGRSPSWKVKKRALVDAYTRRWGNPNPEDIRFIRSLRPHGPSVEYMADVIEGDSDLSASEVIRVAQFREELDGASGHDKNAVMGALYGEQITEDDAPTGDRTDEHDESALVRAAIDELHPAPSAPAWLLDETLAASAKRAGLTVPAITDYVSVSAAAHKVKLAADGVNRAGRPVEAAQEWLDEQIAALNAQAAEALDGVPESVFEIEARVSREGYNAPFDPACGNVLNIVAVEVAKTKTGKTYHRLVSDYTPDGERFPMSVSWFKGRDELLKLAPWLAASATKEQLAEVGQSYPFAARVTYQINEKGHPDFMSIAQA